MPFTPFHFGPGLAIKASVSKSFSFVIFCGTQVIIDLESGYYLLKHEYPVHRFLHTFVGAVVAGIVCGLIGKFALDVAAKLFSNKLHVTWLVAFLSSFVGSISHVFLDSIMHPDVRPFAPFSDANPFLQIVNVPALHGACLALGVMGAIVWIILSVPSDSRGT